MTFIRDLAQLMVDGVLVTSPYGNGVDENSFGFWQQRLGSNNNGFAQFI